MRRKLFSVAIKDCDVETFTVGGAGGGGKDTSNTGVRISHRASGASGVGRDTRSQLKNKQAAFRRMAESKVFRAWILRQASILQGSKSVEELVEEDMQPEKLRVEVRTENGWQKEPN